MEENKLRSCPNRALMEDRSDLAYVPCPRCGKRVSYNSINVISALYIDFKHDCGFEGTFEWVNPDPPVYPKPGDVIVVPTIVEDDRLD